MSRRIIGVTVGTPLSISTIKDKLKPITSVNGVEADENGNVEITIPDSGGNVDLTGYATEQYVKDYAQPAGNYLTEVPSDYATKEFVTNKIAEAELGGEEVDLSGYAQKSELPTKVSQLQNDAGYLTSVPDEYAKTADIPTKPSDIGAQPEGDYALRSEIPSVPVKSVNGKTGAVSLTATDVKARPDSWMPTASDVGALPSSTVIPTVPTKVSAFTNDAGYLTEHQDLSEYAKKTEIPSVPVKSVNGKTGAVSLTASDVGALPSTTVIPTVPTKLSAFTNDSGFITGYTETDPTVPAWAKASTKPSYSKSEVGLGNVDNVKQYSASNPPPYPVTSVNGKTGAVTLTIPTVPTKVSAFTNDAGYLTQHQDISGKADKTGLTLGIYTDGLVYLFVDGAPVGTGIELPTGGGDVYGYVDSENNVVLTGNLADGTYSIKYEMANGNTVSIGNLVLDSNVYYTVTNNLTQCTNSNNAAQVVEGGSYSATITAVSGYELKSVTVTMGGSPVTVSGGVINIANVTGNIVITAVAEEIVVTPTYTNLFDPSKATINQRYNSSGALTALDGYVAINIDGIGDHVPFTATTKIYVKGATFQDDGKARLFTFKTSGETTTNAYSYISHTGMTITDEGNGVESISGVASTFSDGVVRMALCMKVSATAITTADIQNIVITIDEPIA